jgi:hypothetical protein
MGVATARSLSRMLSPPTRLSRIKCCVHCSLCGLLGDAASDGMGENNFSEVRHLFCALYVTMKVLGSTSIL